MKTIAITLIIVFVSAVILFVRGGADFPIVRVLPFLGGHEPGLYDVGALVILAILALGIRRMYRQDDD